MLLGSLEKATAWLEREEKEEDLDFELTEAFLKASLMTWQRVHTFPFVRTASSWPVAGQSAWQLWTPENLTSGG